MELVCRIDAKPKTREMLYGFARRTARVASFVLASHTRRGALRAGSRENFMQGFIYALFTAKYRSFTHILFSTFLVLDITYLISIIAIAATYREYCGRGATPAVYPAVVIMLLQLAFEMSIILAWLSNGRLSGNAKRATKDFLRMNPESDSRDQISLVNQ